MFRPTGAVFEQKRLKFINVFAATEIGGSGGGATKFTRGILEHKVITSFRRVNGDGSLLRQWQQRFITAPGQYDQVHEEIVQHIG